MPCCDDSLLALARKSKIDNEMAEQEKKLKDSQNQIANGKSQLEEQSKIQKENLVNAFSGMPVYHSLKNE